MMHRRSIVHSLILAAGVLAACTDSTGLGDGPSLQLSGGYNLTDTTGAALPQALVAEVRDSSGALAPAGTIVRFEVAGPLLVMLRAPGSTSGGSMIDVPTDAYGQAAAIVQLVSPGTAHVAVTVPSLGLYEVANYTITPGHPEHTVVSPKDTGVYVGSSVTLHGSVTDRNGQVLPDPVTWAAPASGVTVSSAGVVSGTAYGSFYVKATGTGLRPDSARVTVVPRGRLAAVYGHAGGNTVLAYDADGSNLSALAFGGGGTFPRWVPGTSSLVLERAGVGNKAIYIIDAAGVAKPLFSTDPMSVMGRTTQNKPAPSADGAWVYFVASGSLCPAYGPCVARATIDGSNPEVVVPTPASNPSPSPDGSKVAYTDVSIENQTANIRVFDVATHTASTWSVRGNSPVWSPDGTQIAYVTPAKTIAFMTPDGTTTRTLATPADQLYGWSPDGKWLLNGWLVEVATGVALNVTYATRATVYSIK